VRIDADASRGGSIDFIGDRFDGLNGCGSDPDDSFCDDAFVCIVDTGTPVGGCT